MENQDGGKGSSERDWRSQDFRDGMKSQLQQAIVHCAPPKPQAQNAWDLESRAYSGSSSKAEYIDMVGQVIIRLNVDGNGNRAIQGPKEPSLHDDVHGNEVGKTALPSGQRKRGVNSFETTLIHKVDGRPDGPNMSTRPSLNTKCQMKKPRPDSLPTVAQFPVPSDSPPSYLCDKWSHKIYKDPVLTPSGFTYERSGIEDYLKNVGEFDPVTHVKLTADLLVPNHAIKKVVDAFMMGRTDSPVESGSNCPERLSGSDFADP